MSLVLAAGSAHAHHWFAVLFDQDKIVPATGMVTEVQFKNPHGVIELKKVSRAPDTRRALKSLALLFDAGTVSHRNPARHRQPGEHAYPYCCNPAFALNHQKELSED